MWALSSDSQARQAIALGVIRVARIAKLRSTPRRFALVRRFMPAMALASLVAPTYAAPANLAIPEANARIMMRDFARCAANRLGPKLYPLLLEANSRQEIEAKSVVAGGECYQDLPGRKYVPRFNGDHYRYIMADALVRKELLKYSVPDFFSVAPLKHYLPDPIGTKLPRRIKPNIELDTLRFNQEVMIRALSIFGECVVRAAPTGSLDLIKTNVESNAEEGAIKALGPAFSSCIDQNTRLEFIKSVLRGTIALNYYRLVSAYKAQSVSKGQG